MISYRSPRVVVRVLYGSATADVTGCQVEAMFEIRGDATRLKGLRLKNASGRLVGKKPRWRCWRYHRCATRLKGVRLENESAGMRCRSVAKNGERKYRRVADWQSVQAGLITCWNIAIDREEDSDLIDDT